MSEQNRGMQPIYDGLQDDSLQKKETELIETINNILKHEKDTKFINRKTNVKDSYSHPTLDSISDYLESKYKKDADIMYIIIRTWSKYNKDISVSVNGWLLDKILDTFKGFIEMIKQRSFSDRLMGKNKEG
jgi:ERCC4-related helicase